MNTYISTCAMGRYTRLFLVFMACVVVICQAKSWSDESFHKNDDTGDNEEKASLTRLPDNGELFEGDMIMDNRLRRAVWGEKSKKSALLQVELKGYKWPHGIIYYEIDPDFPPENRAMLKKAMYEFRNRTCIRFHKRTNQHDYVYYSAKKDECSSSIGKIGGKQTIYLGVHCLVLGKSSSYSISCEFSYIFQGVNFSPAKTVEKKMAKNIDHVGRRMTENLFNC